MTLNIKRCSVLPHYTVVIEICSQYAQIAPMRVRRSDAGAAHLGGNIYVIGGFTGSVRSPRLCVCATYLRRYIYFRYLKHVRHVLGHMGTWTHGDMDTWRHGHMETWTHGDMDT